MISESGAVEFVAAQDPVYPRVLRELAVGQKQTHWIWFIVPQLRGVGSSHMAQRFGIESQVEARSYLEHGALGHRLRECTQRMLAIPHGDIRAVMDRPDDLKFRSSMTLFAAVAPEETIFDEAINKFFQGERDALTLKLLAEHEKDRT